MRTDLLIGPLPNDQAFKSMNLRGPFLFKPLQEEMTFYAWSVSGFTEKNLLQSQNTESLKWAKEKIMRELNYE